MKNTVFAEEEAETRPLVGTTLLPVIYLSKNTHAEVYCRPQKT